MVFFRILIGVLTLAVGVGGFTIQRAQNESVDDAMHIHDLLWQGMDIGDEQLAATQVFGQAAHGSREAVTAACPNIIVGPFDSGTNLMMMLIKRNFPSVAIPCNGVERGCHTPMLWKHSNSGHVAFRDAVNRLGLNPQDVRVIIVLRSPLSQATSWHKAPYDITPCASRPYFAWGSPCSASIGASLDLRPTGPCPTHGSYMSSCRDNTALVSFQSTVHLYNAYVQQYVSLASSGWFKGVHIVAYEEILYHPNAVIEELARFLSAPMPSTIDICSAPAKTHGAAHGRDLALVIYRQRRWVNEIGPQGVQVLCSRLDMRLLANFTEGNGLIAELGNQQALPYSHDCR